MTSADEPRWHTTATHWGTYEVQSTSGRVTGIRPSASDPEPAPFGYSLPSVLHHPLRITRPMVREGWLKHGPRHGGNRRGAEPFVAVSWDRAVELAAGELERVRTAHGNRAIYGGTGWGSAGRFHQASSQLARFLNSIGGYTSPLGTYSTGAMDVILPYVLGPDAGRYTAVPSWDEIRQHTRLIVAFGGMALKNSQVNYGGLGKHTEQATRSSLRDAGVRVVNVSALRADAEEVEAEWIAPRPNTDVALMLGLAHTLLTEGLADTDFLERCCTGFDEFRAYLLGEPDGQPKTADWAAAICDVPAGVIQALARRIAGQRTVISVSWSVQRARHGEQPHWAAVALAAMSGSMGKPGGGFAPGLGATHNIGSRPAFVPAPSLSRGKNATGSAIPVSRFVEMLENPGATLEFDGGLLTFPDIRLMYWCGGNPFHHQQDLNRLLRAWQRPETIIVHEHWWTPTARHADIVFPAATSLERNDIAAGMSDGWLTAMPQAAAPPGDARGDYEIFSAIAARLGAGERFTEGRTADGWVREFYEETRRRLASKQIAIPPFDEFWQQGQICINLPERYAPSPIQALRQNPTGAPLGTATGRVEITHAVISAFGYGDCPGHPTWLEPDEWLGSPLAERFPLHLITNQPRTRLHSQLDHGPVSRAAEVNGREVITINLHDAAARGIVDGDIVRIFNERGACLAAARLSDGIRPGVVQLPTGAWYDPLEPGVPGSLEVHGNPNVLTLDRGTSRLAQACSAQTCLVEVERFVDDPPPVRVFDPPVIVEGEQE